jgi:hypothetical protein
MSQTIEASAHNRTPPDDKSLKAVGDAFEVELRIAAERLSILKGHIARINRKAARHNIPEYTLATGRRGSEFILNESEGIGHDIAWVEVTVTGHEFRLGDYRLAAMINHRDEPKSFKTFGGFEIPLHYRECEPACDHCQTERDRAVTFLVVNADGELKHVGKGCLEEFTGYSPAAVFGATSIYDEFSALMKAELGILDEERNYKGGEPVTKMDEYLPFVAAEIRRHGWISKSASADEYGPYYREIPTSVAALDTMRKAKPLESLLTDQDCEVARAALLAARDKYPSDAPQLEEFVANMTAMAHADYFTNKKAGFAAYIVQEHLRTLSENRAKAAVSPNSVHIGEEKKRFETEVRVLKVVASAGEFGTTYIHRMADAHGNSLVWFCSGKPLAEGRAFAVKATVKEGGHGEYNGVKQTALTRVVPLREVEWTADFSNDVTETPSL